jgi:molybdopterin-containing oxidoreductase family iron-sulfur binding subunit
LITRRDFLKVAGAGAAALTTASTVGTALASASRTALAEGPHPGDQGAGTQRWIMVIDLARCDGCGDCTEACTAMHMVPFGQEWIKVYKMQNDSMSGSHFFPRPCMQCDNPPCVNVCPVGASYKREDGIVFIDQDLCIGCRFCLAACPYSARSFDWAEPPHTAQELSQPYSVETNIPHRRGVAEKCVFCSALTRQGQLPACVGACDMGALYFGDEHEDAVTNSLGETYRLSELLADGGAHRHLEELGTEPRVWYLPPRKLPVPASNDSGSMSG